MDALFVFIIILATAVICLFLFQAYTIYDNYHNIIEFNEKYGGLEYSRSPGGLYIDKRVFDPNDSETDPKAKWRCVNYNNNQYASASKFGYLATSSRNPVLFTNLEDCVYYNYTRGEIGTIWNPCAEYGEGSAECSTLKSHL
ncbi:hypothetical protein FPV192 [Fowlpox virus]|uniref:Envelope protein A28 homolog n=2 Tax=Fowlpox virus TaxID=10261 RepID=A28_FOWPN|nr:hypothetical protein FPV192 [Fowlpox virus]Q9J541.1 RecName: Full=Envelope protein A28 homolog; AltName: Full=Protein FPV192 [Fowlpox virus strain NVSL]UNS14421.1 ALPV-257 [Albatrosspox virus]WPD90904.1 A28-like hypothetical protein [Avipoxvirus sp.]CAE52730.1 A28L orthologue [Fowlpox virus isolate HP-438/Munich]AAF44536.1 ORF FPV192 [Fowlpox virus]ART91625.1 A28L ortholog [Fowlpox virus]